MYWRRRTENQHVDLCGRSARIAAAHNAGIGFATDIAYFMTPRRADHGVAKQAGQANVRFDLDDSRAWRGSTTACCRSFHHWMA